MPFSVRVRTFLVGLQRAELTWHVIKNAATFLQGVVGVTFQMAVRLCVYGEVTQVAFCGEVALPLLWWVASQSGAGVHQPRPNAHNDVSIQRHPEVLVFNNREVCRAV